MKKEKNILLTGLKRKQWELQLDIKDSILNWVEQTSGRIHNWAWDKRWKERDPGAWLREYREWKKNNKLKL